MKSQQNRIESVTRPGVEQAEFKELSVAASVDGGATASVLLYKSGNKVVRSFQPDFILVRQNVKDGPQEDYKNILLGFQYGNVPSVNSLESIYNFQASLCDADHTLVTFVQKWALKCIRGG